MFQMSSQEHKFEAYLQKRHVCATTAFRSATENKWKVKRFGISCRRSCGSGFTVSRGERNAVKNSNRSDRRSVPGRLQ